MIITRTPYRVSFFGGGTDYPVWYRQNSGQVLSTTIDKYLYISCRYLPPFFEHRLRLVYSKIEACEDASELHHPTARETLKFVGISSDVEIHYDGDLPARSGMGSSSAFTVGLLNACYAYLGKSVTPHKLAKESIHIEQMLVGEQVGSQDQVSAAHGGLNKIQFAPNNEILVSSVSRNSERIQQIETHLMLFFTGIARTASEVADTYVRGIASKEKQLNKIYAMVDDAVEILDGSHNVEDFGSLLHESWLEKRSLSGQVSNQNIDNIYKEARAAGALGGKVLGAGGGGMILFFVPLEKQNSVREKLSELIHVPFQFDASGSQVIFQDKHQRYEEGERLRSSGRAAKFIDIKDL